MSGHKNDVTYAATVAFAVATMRELGWMPPSNTSTDPPQDDLIERLRAVEWEETDDCGRMPDDPTHKCVFVDMRPDAFRALLREAAAALEAAREDAWQPIETCPNADRVVMFCDERQNIWTDCAWNRSSAATGFYATHWRPLPAPPVIDQARGKAGQEVGNG